MNQFAEIFTLIAQKHLDIETLDTRDSDRLDFHNVSVWNIKRALQAAFMAGCEVGIVAPHPSETEIARTLQ